MFTGEDRDLWEVLSGLNSPSDGSSETNEGDHSFDGIDCNRAAVPGGVPFNGAPDISFGTITPEASFSDCGEQDLRPTFYPEESESPRGPYYTLLNLSLLQGDLGQQSSGSWLLNHDTVGYPMVEAASPSFSTGSSSNASSPRMTRSSARQNQPSPDLSQLAPHSTESRANHPKPIKKSKKRKEDLAVKPPGSLSDKKPRKEICYCKVITCVYSRDANLHRANTSPSGAGKKPKRFTRYHDRRRHYNTAHGQAEEQYMCRLCGAVDLRKDKVLKHGKTFHGVLVKPKPQPHLPAYLVMS